MSNEMHKLWCVQTNNYTFYFFLWPDAMFMWIVYTIHCGQSICNQKKKKFKNDTSVAK